MIMLILACGVAGLVTLAVGYVLGRAAGAGACVAAAALLIPSATIGIAPVLWRDLFLLAMLAVLLVWHFARDRADPFLPGPSWQLVDLIILAAVLVPTYSAYQNGTEHPVATTWPVLVEYASWIGAPYLVGRLLLRDGVSLKRAALVIVAAVTLYAPLALFESMTRPALMERVFGIEGPNVTRMKMLMNFWGPEGYRAYVFTGGWFQLMLLQLTALFLAVGLWFAGRESRHRGTWRSAAAVGVIVNLAALAVLSRSWAGVLLPVGAAGLFGLLMVTRWRFWLALGCLLVPAYVGLRATEVIPTAPLPLRHADDSEFLGGRGRSINARTSDERSVLDVVEKSPVFGTGTQYRGEDGGYNVSGKYNIDGGAFVTLLRSGYLGLACVFLAFAIPAALPLFRLPRPAWPHSYAPLMIATSVILVADLVNSVPNASSMAMHGLLAGALVTLSKRMPVHSNALAAAPESGHESDFQRWARICGVSVPADGDFGDLPTASSGQPTQTADAHSLPDQR